MRVPSCSRSDASFDRTAASAASHRRESAASCLRNSASVAEPAAELAAGAAAASAAAAASGGDDGEEEECCLCMEPFRRDDQVRLLPCKHFFHAACVDQWFETKRYQVRSCPLCKQDPLAGTEGETFRQRDAQEVVARVLEEAAAEAEAAEAEAAEAEAVEAAEASRPPTSLVGSLSFGYVDADAHVDAG